MSAAKKISIAIGILVLLLSVTSLLFWYAVSTNVVSRVSIPDSTLTVVLFADVSGCYSCQLFDDGDPISGLQPLGPYASRRCSSPELSSVSNIVTVGWRDGNYHYSVAVDTEAKRLFIASNNELLP